MRRHDDLVPWFDPDGKKSQLQRFQTVCNTDTLGGTAIRRELGFEGLNLIPTDVLTTSEDSGSSGVQLILDFQVGGLEIEKRYFHDPLAAEMNSA
jgi:hypothetical protein